ncbi:MAG: hypothetical protein WCD04_12120 [Terriglobia bacterium]|jgi:hypothetical protein
MRVLLNGKQVGVIDCELKLTTQDPRLRNAYDRIEKEGMVVLGPGKTMTDNISSTTETVYPLTSVVSRN